MSWWEVFKLKQVITPTTKITQREEPKEEEEERDCCQEAILEITERLVNLHKAYDDFEGEYRESGLKVNYVYLEPEGNRVDWDKSIHLMFKNNYDINNKRLMCHLLESITADYRPDYYGNTRMGVNLHAGYGNANLYFAYHGPEKDNVIKILDAVKRYAVGQTRQCQEEIQYYKDNKHVNPDGINRIWMD
jgi:hypothetical protein